MALEWPEGYDRTPPEDREPYPGNISVGHRAAFTSIDDELDAWGCTLDRVEFAATPYARDPDIPHKSDDPDDPGVAAYFRRTDEHADQGYAIACDRWNSLRDNARAIALYVRRKRLAERCGVSTASSEFSTAALPPTGDDAIAAPAATSEPAPYEVLQVAPGAGRDVVKAAYRARAKELHSDAGGSTDGMTRLNKAKEAMLDE